MLQTNAKKVLSPILLAVGTIMMGVALYLDFTGSANTARGALLVIGAVAVLLGLYLFPTVEHHKSIINFIFLFPLLFTFAVTVIIPLCLGVLLHDQLERYPVYGICGPRQLRRHV